MLKLRNAVLTALLAFCLAMPFVSCSFNDGATGDVSGDVEVQSGNNQNGGNGGSTGGSGTNSGEDEDHDHDNNGGNENPSGGNNGGSGNENPSGGNENPSGGNENPSGGNENPSGGNEKPGEGTTYVVKYNGDIIEKSLSESMWSSGVEEVNLIEDVDYTIDGTVITLTDSGYEKVLPLLGDSGDDGEHGVIPPVTDGPVTDVPVPDVPGVEGTVYTVKYGDNVIVPDMPESALSAYKQKYGLVEVTDYTISGNVITLTDSGLKKVMDASAGEGGGQEPGTDEPGTDYPGTEYPGTDYPGTDYPGTGEPGSGDETVYTVMYNGQPLVDENGEVVKIPAAALDYYKTILSEGDYTINGNVITLTDSGLKKVMDAGAGAGE